LYDATKQKIANLTHVRVDFFVFGGEEVSSSTNSSTSSRKSYTFAELTFTHKACTPLFDDDIFYRFYGDDILDRFYGYVASNPEKNIPPDAVFSIV
jgi:hypothetical protein